MSMHRMAGTLAVLSLSVGLPAFAQPKPPSPPDLPVKQIVLFSSGVGYYQREGQVDGSTRIDLQFHVNDINDLLKSLVLEDRGGGQIATINYDNRNPIEMTLKSFALDLTTNPSFGDLLNQARGEQVEVVAAEQRTGPAQTETILGVIVGVEKMRQPVGKDQIVEVSQLNLLSKEGIRGVPMAQVQRVRFLKPSLDQEFRKALEVLAAGHDKQKKTVSLNFTGDGKRSVKVGYVTESPIWKTSYRLSLRKDVKGKEEVQLQGWAIVENTSDEDWNNVQLGLVSGRPLSFQMDLYQPLFVTRPLVEPELFASLRPPVYGGNLQRKSEAGFGVGGVPAPMAAPAPAKEAAAGRGRAMVEEAKVRGLLKEKADRDGINLHRDVATAAVTTELGEYFQYSIRQPVSLPRQKSALLPIINEEVKGIKVSIYNEGVHGKYPLLGLRFTNSTTFHLCQGPITVFEQSGYAGDSRINDLQPKETRLISYAIDLGTEVDPQMKDSEDLLKIKLVKGIVHSEYMHKETKTYKVVNRSESVRSVLIEHPYRPNFEHVRPAKPDERSREVYRFEIKAEPNQPVDFVVEEKLPRFTQVALTNSSEEDVLFLVRSKASSPQVKAALTDALQLKAKWDEVRQEVAREENALKIIEQDQSRMRANMERVPQTSEAYKRYIKKFDDQETEIEQRRAKIAKLQDRLEEQRKAYEGFLANLTID